MVWDTCYEFHLLHKKEMVDYVKPNIACYKRYIKSLEDNVKFVFNHHQGHHFRFRSHIEATLNNKGSHENTPIYCIQKASKWIKFVNDKWHAYTFI